MKIKYLAALIASVFVTQEADAASNVLITKKPLGLSVSRVPNTAKVNSGTTVTLTAKGVKSGYEANWSGVDCNNGPVCRFTMPNASTTVTVSSVKVAATPPTPKPIPTPVPIKKYSLTVSVSPSGAGTVTGAGDYNPNSRILVTQKSNEGFAFLGWSDSNCAKLSSCRLVLNSNTSITAKFETQLPSPTLTIPAANKVNVLPNVKFSVATLKGVGTYQLVLAKKDVQLSLDSIWGACANLDAAQCKQTEPQVSKTFTGFDDFLKKDGAEWQWRVRGYSNNGVAGKWSLARSFTMAGEKLPDFTAFIKREKITWKYDEQGKKYCNPQCVDFVRDTFNLQGKITGNAYTYWNKLPSYGYSQRVNGGKIPPKPGDVIVWNKNVGGGNGHVAIVESVDITAKKIVYQDSNWGKNYLTDCQYRRHTKNLIVSDGKYTIEDKHIEGWLSKN